MEVALTLRALSANGLLLCGHPPLITSPCSPSPRRILRVTSPDFIPSTAGREHHPPLSYLFSSFQNRRLRSRDDHRSFLCISYHTDNEGEHLSLRSGNQSEDVILIGTRSRRSLKDRLGPIDDPEVSGSQADGATIMDKESQNEYSDIHGQITQRSEKKYCGCSDRFAVAAKFASHDAALLARGIAELDMRARRDVALISSHILLLDAKAKWDASRMDSEARRRVQRLQHLALRLEENACAELGNVAEQHWNDGKLEADLRLADIRARRRALEDAYVATEAIKVLRSTLLNLMKKRGEDEGAALSSAFSAVKLIRRENKDRDYAGSRGRENEDEGVAFFLPQHMSSMAHSQLARRMAVLEELYKCVSFMERMDDSSASLEADDSEELEFILAALLDMDEVNGANGATLVAESMKSPDAATRLAVADALAGAPSLEALGNAGMVALQQLASDSNQEVAMAASQALDDVQRQWKELAALHTLPPNMRLRLSEGSHGSQDDSEMECEDKIQDDRPDN